MSCFNYDDDDDDYDDGGSSFLVKFQTFNRDKPPERVTTRLFVRAQFYFHFSSGD